MKQVAAALVKAQKEFGPALKTSTNPHFRSKYADLGACVEAVVGALNNNGIYLMQLTEERENGVCVQTQFIHESGEIMSGGSLFMPASKIDAQGFGSALSYARRYSLMAACGIAPEEDDANSAKPAAPKAPVPPVPVPKVVQPVAPATPAVPAKKLEGAAGQWQLKVSAQPETTVEDWAISVLKVTNFALEMAQTPDDVTSIFKVNRTIFDRLKADDKPSFDMVLDKFKQFKEKLNEQVSE
jgi:hypothetical protein